MPDQTLDDVIAERNALHLEMLQWKESAAINVTAQLNAERELAEIKAWKESHMHGACNGYMGEKGYEPECERWKRELAAIKEGAVKLPLPPAGVGYVRKIIRMYGEPSTPNALIRDMASHIDELRQSATSIIASLKGRLAERDRQVAWERENAASIGATLLSKKQLLESCEIALAERDAEIAHLGKLISDLAKMDASDAIYAARNAMRGAKP